MGIRCPGATRITRQEGRKTMKREGGKKRTMQLHFAKAQRVQIYVYNSWANTGGSTQVELERLQVLRKSIYKMSGL